jgi:hypothetical protein
MPAPTVAGHTALGEGMALPRDDFASFAARCFRKLNPRTSFAANRHIDLIAGIPGTARNGRPSGDTAVRDGYLSRALQTASGEEAITSLGSVN